MILKTYYFPWELTFSLCPGHTLNGGEIAYVNSACILTGAFPKFKLVDKLGIGPD